MMKLVAAIVFALGLMAQGALAEEKACLGGTSIKEILIGATMRGEEVVVMQGAGLDAFAKVLEPVMGKKGSAITAAMALAPKELEKLIANQGDTKAMTRFIWFVNGCYGGGRVLPAQMVKDGVEASLKAGNAPGQNT